MENKELTEYKEQVKDLVEMKDPAIDIILSAAYLPQEFQTITGKELAEIRADLPVLNRNKNVYGRKNSQVTGKMMSLQMLRHGPYNAIKQCDAKIDGKRNALKEAGFRRLKDMNKIDKLERDLTKDTYIDDNGIEREMDEFKYREIQIEIAEARVALVDSMLAIEHALKEYVMYVRTRKEIMEAHNIPENFSEADYVEAEIRENIETAFQHALRDIMVNHGQANHGTLEWVEQFGISPIVAYYEAKKFLAKSNGADSSSIDIDNLYKWYDEMYEKYKDEYKKAMKRLGIKNLMTEDVAYLPERTED